MLIINNINVPATILCLINMTLGISVILIIFNFLRSICIIVIFNIFVFISNIAIATNTETENVIAVYYCQMTDGTVGYYDLPCQNIVDSKKNIYNAAQILPRSIIEEQKIILKPIKSINNGHSIHNIFVDYKKMNSTAIPYENLANKRCINSLKKIKLIEELLEKHQALSVGQTNKEIITKLNRSLIRYNKIKKQYCDLNGL